MSGLVISLKPNEKFLINGALIMNGDRHSQICIVDDNVNVLRMSDALHPKDVNSPVKRVYYAVQLIVSGDACYARAEADIKAGLNALKNVFSGTALGEKLERAEAAFLKHRFYSVLNILKSLFALEESMLNAYNSRTEGATDVAQRKQSEAPLLVQAG